jgi:HD-GYP domain-containing protein (c-di-GMP phosphodiesterase class II)
MTEQASLLGTLLGLSMIVEARDPYTGGHLWRVSQFSKLLAQQAGLPNHDSVLCEIGGFLHDLGKVAVPDVVLNKPDHLTDPEYAVVKTHPAVGGRLLAGHPLAKLAIEAVTDHHERPDGKGYPRGLEGEKLSKVARIVSIADAFDAMTSTRAYRQGMPINQALAIIGNGLGNQFDRELGKHFLALDSSAQLAHIVGHSEPGLPLQQCGGCGAPLALRSAQRDGDYVYCRCCGGESRLRKQGNTRTLEMTWQHGEASALAPDSDRDLIGAMVDEIAPVVL